MADQRKRLAAFHICSILMAFHLAHGKLPLSSSLRSLSKKALTMDLSDVKVEQAGPQFSAYAIGAGVVAYRSGVVSGLSQLDRGENEEAMETFRVAMASLTLDTTQAFGLPIISAVIDKVVGKYGAQFPKTVAGLKTYNQMLGDSILKQVADVASPAMLDDANEVLDTLDTLKNQMKTDFGTEVDSFLKSSQAYDDLVRPLQKAKTWAKVAKWGDFLLGPIFDAANIAFSGWQLHEAIKSGNRLAIASNSIGIVGSIVGIGTFVVGSLATAGSVVAAVAGPVGIIIGCILTLASLIIDLINEYNPEQKINEHLKLVHSLTKASKEQLLGVHYDMLQKVTNNDVKAGFGTVYDVNQAMLVKATIEDQWDTIKGLRGNEERVEFKPELVKSEENHLVVGEVRVFNKAHYANWIFKPSGTEEVGYNYYGKKVKENEEGIFVRLNTEMVTNAKDHMWFWLNGADVTTFAEGEENAAVDDNVNLGDFRTFYTTSDRYVSVKTGGGNDLVQLTGVICAAEQQKLLSGRCLLLSMGEGYDTLSFEGMDMRREKLLWHSQNNDLTKTKKIIGVVFDAKDDWVSYRLRGDGKEVTETRFCGMNSVEGFIGTPLNDIVKMDDRKVYHIKESAGKNVYEIYYSHTADNRQHIIEDNSDTPGKLVLHKDGLSWTNVAFDTSTNIIVLVLGRDDIAEIFLKRTKSGLEDFRVRIGGSTKKISELHSVGNNTDLLLPFVPYKYMFDRDLIARGDQITHVELCLPVGDYPSKPVSRTIRFANRYSKLILSNELLAALRGSQYTFIAKRRGGEGADGRWVLFLQRQGGSGGWKLKVGRISNFVLGAPGRFQELFSLSAKNDNQVDIFREYQTIAGERMFDSTGSYYGDDSPEKVLLKYPKNFHNISPPAQHVIDLKGPQQPSANGKNELVIDGWIISGYFQHDLSRYMKMELVRASREADWHLKIFSNWSERVLRVDITLKHVHTITADQLHLWKLILDLYNSQELSYDLNDVMFDRFYDSYFA